MSSSSANSPRTSESADFGADDQGRAVQGAAERRGEGAVGDLLRRGEVDRPHDLLVVDDVPDRSDLVGERDERPPLLPEPSRPPAPSAQDREPAAEGTAVGVGDRAGARVHDADADLAGRVRRRLPGDADPGEERRADRRGLVDAVGPGVAVVAAGRARHEHAGRRAASRRSRSPGTSWPRRASRGSAACRRRPSASRRRPRPRG